MFCKLFHKIEKEVNITFIQKVDKGMIEKENYRTISLMDIDTKVLNKKS
jgi:hypothetical protein